jgi:CheY-like chemotaxis protein
VFSDCAADGRAALDRLRERDYSVVLLDITLPQMGVEPVLDFLSTVPISRRPVILVLAPPNAARSLDVDLVQIVLRKPCNLRQLSEIVSSCFHAATAGASVSAIPLPANKARIPIV